MDPSILPGQAVFAGLPVQLILAPTLLAVNVAESTSRYGPRDAGGRLPSQGLEDISLKNLTKKEPFVLSRRSEGANRAWRVDFALARDRPRLGRSILTWICVGPSLGWSILAWIRAGPMLGWSILAWIHVGPWLGSSILAWILDGPTWILTVKSRKYRENARGFHGSPDPDS